MLHSFRLPPVFDGYGQRVEPINTVEGRLKIFHYYDRKNEHGTFD